MQTNVAGLSSFHLLSSHLASPGGALEGQTSSSYRVVGGGATRVDNLVADMREGSREGGWLALVNLKSAGMGVVATLCSPSGRPLLLCSGEVQKYEVLTRTPSAGHVHTKEGGIGGVAIHWCHCLESSSPLASHAWGRRCFQFCSLGHVTLLCPERGDAFQEGAINGIAGKGRWECVSEECLTIVDRQAG